MKENTFYQKDNGSWYGMVRYLKAVTVKEDGKIIFLLYL